MPDQVQEIYEEALVHLEAWELDKAEDAFRNLLELDPEHAQAWNKLGVVFARKKDLKQAEDCFNLAIQYDSNFANPYSNLGNIYAERGWDDRAKTAYEQALALDPGNPTTTHNLGVLYRKAGNIGKGVELMKQANRAERTLFRRQMSTSPEAKKMSRLVWLIMIGLGLIVFYFFNR